MCWDVFGLENCQASLTGIICQMTAMLDPMSAIQTTETAAGTRTRYSPKCRVASRTPKAELFIAVSMAVVRQTTSENLHSLQTQYPAAPPMRWRSMTGSCRTIPALMMASEHPATEAPTRRTVERTPTTGQAGSTVRQNFGAAVLSATPRTMGTRTTWSEEMATPMASTGTMAPSRSLASSGVMTMVPSVVDVVMTTLRATSPRAMYVHRFDAWPPLMEPTRTRPAISGIESWNSLPMVSPRSGIIT
mmetsp:Transcript_2982/g.7252  ORF Transcript_2982/g.7252 Transcript_2982/m.7252 type:complete len:247 (-) Transcript_2982:323-1063(-)